MTTLNTESLPLLRFSCVRNSWTDYSVVCTLLLYVTIIFCFASLNVSDICSVMSNSLRPQGQRVSFCQAPLFMKFSRQENWSGLPFPSPFC